MAKIYLDKLSELVLKLKIEEEIPQPLETKHFFSGAALYIDKTIAVTWSPVGLAFKLPEDKVNKLIKSGKAKELKYFPKGHVKKGYALFENPEEKKPGFWKNYFLLASAEVES